MEITTKDIIWLSLTIILAILKYLDSKKQLPKQAQKYLKKIGKKQIDAIVLVAASYSDKNEPQRIAWARKELQTFAEQQFGVTVPDSIANLLIEYCYNIWKWRGAK